MNTKYELFYDLAYELAEFAYSHDEVPVGAVIIKDNTYEVVSSSYNQMKSNKNHVKSNKNHIISNKIKK